VGDAHGTAVSKGDGCLSLSQYAFRAILRDGLSVNNTVCVFIYPHMIADPFTL